MLELGDTVLEKEKRKISHSTLFADLIIKIKINKKIQTIFEPDHMLNMFAVL